MRDRLWPDTDGPTRSPAPGDRADVIHIVPADIARGAQHRAQAMRGALDGDLLSHRTLALFAGPTSLSRVDFTLAGSARSRRSVLSPLVTWRLRRALKTLRPRVVVAYGSESLRYAAMARPKQVKLVYSKTGITTGHLGRLRLGFHRWMARRADVVAAVSTETATEAQDLLGVGPEHIVVVSNGRDPTVFVPSGRLRPDGPVRLLWVGHLTDGKRPDLFLEAVRSLNAAGAGVTATMVGEGPLMARLQADVDSGTVRLLGQRLDIAELMQDADVFVFTSDREGEGLPGVLIEAALCGLAIVATDVPGVRDVLTDGSSGLVVAEGDVEALTDAIGQLAANHHLRSEMAAAGRRHALENLTVAVSAERWRGLLDRLGAGADVHGG